MKKLLSFLLIVILLLSLLGCNGKQVKDARYYVDGMKERGMPIAEVIDYTEQSDMNNLLGRPNQYTSKSSFIDEKMVVKEEKTGNTKLDKTIDDMDKRTIEMFGKETSGTIEVFTNKKDLETRKSYIERVSKGASFLNQYIFVKDNALMRIEYKLTPAEAEEYNKIFQEL